ADGRSLARRRRRVERVVADRGVVAPAREGEQRPEAEAAVVGAASQARARGDAVAGVVRSGAVLEACGGDGDAEDEGDRRNKDEDSRPPGEAAHGCLPFSGVDETECDASLAGGEIRRDRLKSVPTPARS